MCSSEGLTVVIENTWNISQLLSLCQTRTVRSRLQTGCRQSKHHGINLLYGDLRRHGGYRRRCPPPCTGGLAAQARGRQDTDVARLRSRTRCNFLLAHFRLCPNHRSLMHSRTHSQSSSPLTAHASSSWACPLFTAIHRSATPHGTLDLSSKPSAGVMYLYMLERKSRLRDGRAMRRSTMVGSRSPLRLRRHPHESDAHLEQARQVSTGQTCSLSPYDQP